MIGRFARYAERRWNFLGILENVRDTRQNPPIPTSAVFLSVFGMHAVRHGSINALEQQLKIAGLGITALHRVGHGISRGLDRTRQQARLGRYR